MASVTPAPRPAVDVEKRRQNRKLVKTDCRGLQRQVMKRTDEDSADGRLPSLLVSQKILVGLETRKSNGHFGYDPRKNGTETLVERQGGLSLNDLRSGSDKPSWLRLSLGEGKKKGTKVTKRNTVRWCGQRTYSGEPARTRELHSNFDRVERLTT